MLVEKIKSDMFDAKKNKEAHKALFLSSLYADSVKIGKDNGNRETTDAEVVAVAKKYMKGLDETIQVLIKENKDITKFKLEQEWTLMYLPKQLDSDILKNIINEYIKESNTKNVGDIMKHLKTHYEGQYDGKMASEIVKQVV